MRRIGRIRTDLSTGKSTVTGSDASAPGSGSATCMSDMTSFDMFLRRAATDYPGRLKKICENAALAHDAMSVEAAGVDEATLTRGFSLLSMQASLSACLDNHPFIFQALAIHLEVVRDFAFDLVHVDGESLQMEIIGRVHRIENSPNVAQDYQSYCNELESMLTLGNEVLSSITPSITDPTWGLCLLFGHYSGWRRAISEFNSH